MKLLLLMILGLGSMLTYASQYNGYIVKYKNGVKHFLGHNVVHTSFGNFTIIRDKKQLDHLKASNEIEYIEPNYIYDMWSVAENDTAIEDKKFKKQWALYNTGKNSRQWGIPGNVGEDVNALKAWNITIGSRDIIVAILDSGIDYHHPDLQGNIWINRMEKDGQPGVDDDGNGYVDDIYGYDFANNDSDPLDDHGHGTHCAGVIGAVHNKIGIRGIMGKVQLLGLKFMSKQGHGETINAIKAIDYAIKAGARVISNSWGGDAYSQALKDAIVEAKKHNIIFVVAAGNSRFGNDNDSNPVYPASYKVENVISVGASNPFGNRAVFSNSGKNSVHIFAPGVNILSTVLKGRYKKMDGTSMAAPLVAGAMGLLVSEERGISCIEAKERLMNTAEHHPLLDDATASGRMDVFALLTDE